MKKSTKYFLRGCVAFGVLFVIMAAQGMYRFDVMIFPVNSHIIFNLRSEKLSPRSTEQMVDLIPEIFSTGDSIEKVDSTLRFASYRETPPDRVWTKYKDRAGKGKYVYIRNYKSLACHNSLYVFVEFNEDKKLVLAQGIQKWACL